jgi:hypothetical protein
MEMENLIDPNLQIETSSPGVRRTLVSSMRLWGMKAIENFKFYREVSKQVNIVTMWRHMIIIFYPSASTFVRQITSGEIFPSTLKNFLPTCHT